MYQILIKNLTVVFVRLSAASFIIDLSDSTGDKCDGKVDH